MSHLLGLAGLALRRWQIYTACWMCCGWWPSNGWSGGNEEFEKRQGVHNVEYGALRRMWEMTLRNFARTAGMVAVAGLLSLPATLFAAPAQADETQDDYFLNFLDEKKVPYDSELRALRVAKSTCKKLDKIGDPDLLGYKTMYGLTQNMGFSESEAGTFIEGSVYVYCPSVWGIEPEPEPE